MSGSVPPAGLFNIVGSGLLAQQQRMSLIASNLANANSVAMPGGAPYRAVEPVFMADPNPTTGTSEVQVAGLVQSNAAPKLKYDPGNPYANSAGYVQMSNVEPTQQIVDLIDASQSYASQIAVLNQSERLDSAMIQSFVP